MPILHHKNHAEQIKKRPAQAGHIHSYLKRKVVPT
jgi:hypothetical protein